MVNAPDDGAGGDDESMEAGPIQQIDKIKINRFSHYHLDEMNKTIV